MRLFNTASTLGLKFISSIYCTKFLGITSIFSICLSLDKKRHYFGLHISKAIDRTSLLFILGIFCCCEQVKLDYVTCNS